MLDIKIQGMCQGNGAAPVGWAVVSIEILNKHKKKGHGSQILCPILLIRSNLAVVLYVDDTDVIHLKMERQENVVAALRGLQESITSWGKLLIAKGGSLKPSKCFYHLIFFSWKMNGMWVYDTNEGNMNPQLDITLPDCSSAPIEHCGVDVVCVNLASVGRRSFAIGLTHRCGLVPPPPRHLTTKIKGTT